MRNAYLFLITAVLVGCGGGGGGKQPPNADGDGVADAQDCAPVDSTRWRVLQFQAIDAEGDGHAVNSPGELCVGAALPSTHFASAVPASDVDCDDTAASVWRLLPYEGRDADMDGFNVAASGEVCSGAALPSGYHATTSPPVSADCDDANAAVWRLRMTYGDADGDGVGAGPGDVTCIGAGAAPNRSLLGYDPVDDPNDPNAITSSTVELASWQLDVAQN